MQKTKREIYAKKMLISTHNLHLICVLVHAMPYIMHISSYFLHILAHNTIYLHILYYRMYACIFLHTWCICSAYFLHISVYFSISIYLKMPCMCLHMQHLSSYIIHMLAYFCICLAYALHIECAYTMQHKAAQK